MAADPLLKQHSPLPWRLGTDGHIYTGETGGELVATVSHGDGEDSVKGANGTLIVAAVKLWMKTQAQEKDARKVANK